MSSNNFTTRWPSVLQTGLASTATRSGTGDEYPDLPPSSAAVPVNGALPGTVNDADDTDFFRVTLTAGHTYRFDALGAGTGNGTLQDPRACLFRDGAYQTPLAYNDDASGTNLNSRFTYTPTASGSYWLAVTSATAAGGTYRVTVTDTSTPAAADDYAATTATTGRLAVGGTASGTINSNGDNDWFRITLSAGQSYRLEALGADTGNGTLSDPFLTLYNSAGTTLASNDDGGSTRNSLLTYTVSASGTYYVGARGFDSGVGSYLVRASVDDYAASTATSGRVAPNTTRAGTIEAAGDQDWFAASLTAGTTYTIELQGAPSNHGTLADPYLRGIYSAAGTLLAGTGNDDYGTSRESRVVFTPTSSGTYYLAAGAYGNGTGTYQLKLSGTASADLSANINTTGSVAVGSSIRSLITPAGDVDWVRTTLTRGQTYVIELNADTTASNPLADPYFRGIYSATGTLIAGTSNDDYGIGTNSRVTFTATSTGTYYLAAGGFGTHLGAYELRLSTGTAPVTDAQANSIATTTSLAVGTATTGSIDFARDQDWFRVSLAAGQTYRISARGADSGAGTLADPRLVGLFDATGHIIVGTGVDNSDGTPDAQTLYTATAGGTYYVAVAAADDGTGSYAVQVQTVTSSADLAANVGTTATLGVGGTQSSAIDTAGDTDWFRVSLTAGTTYQINMLGSATSSGSLTDPFIVGLYDAAGTYVNNTRDDDGGSGNNARVTFTATSSGTYYLAAGAYGSASGSYQVTLTALGSDSTAPTLLGTAPSDNATSVAPNSNLSLQFSEAVRAGTGHIVITGGGATRTIAVTDTSQVSFNGSTLTINPSQDLAANTDYSVTLGAGVVRDTAGNAFAGITSNTQFNFHTTAAGQQDTWTVLVYMAADNNLESFGIDDLNEMESVTLPSNANVAVLMDRAGGYDASNGNWTDTRWGAVTHDNNTSTLGSSLTSLGERNTGDAATLTQFINNAVAANPASHYALIVWDHGGGLSGTSWDDASGGDNLSLAEYRAALQAASVSHFDIVGFDACLQGMIEQAWDVAGLSDVLVASQELEPGDGWEYQNVLGTLATNPSATTFDLGAAMVSSYGNHYAGQADITMAATRTASLTALKTALDSFANTAINAGSGIAGQLLSAASRATAIDGGSQNYRDLGDFMQEVASSMPGTAVATAAQQVYAALDTAVLSQSGSVAGANGLSIYLPLSFIASTYNTDRYTFLQDSGWGNFLRFMLGDQGNDTLTGNANANTFMGFGGNDVLRGAGGNDTLTGGAGSDQFVFDAALSGAGVDTLTDFTRGADKIVLDDDVFTALGTTGTVAGVALSAAAFNAGSSAVDAADRIVYNSSSGALYYDSDGSGSAAARQIALLGTTTHPTGLSASDFLVIA
jgi:Ca2+-binding RTX toxin-like protein/methionine-rich copper-binding protein CopC